MLSKSFTVKKRDFEKKPITILQHKLRLLMKCYTITNLVLDDIEFTITFKKNYKINGIRMEDPKEYVIKYSVLDIEDSPYIVLKFTI